MSTENPLTGMRIGELSRRTGVSQHVLRVWERRYGLLRPSRTHGGFRLYGPDDERRVLHVVALRDQGVPAGEAATRALTDERRSPQGPTESGPGPESGLAERLSRAVDDFDEAAASAVLDDALRTMSFDRALVEVLVPYLRDLGTRWEQGRTTVAHEHFASMLLRRRLSSYAQAWSPTSGPSAVLACPAGEQHDLMLLSFGILLARAGWAVRLLGPDTPLVTLAAACDRVRPDLVVLAAVRRSVFAACATEITALAGRHRVALAGPGASTELARACQATLLPGDPPAAVAAASALVRGRAFDVSPA